MVSLASPSIILWSSGFDHESACPPTHHDPTPPPPPRRYAPSREGGRRPGGPRGGRCRPVGRIERSPPRPVPIDPAPAPRGLFLPAAEPEPSTLPGAERGAALFEERCAECHTVGGGDRRGPDLARAALRRNPAWVRAMVASPDSMFEADSVAQWVLEVHGIEPEQATMENPDLGALVTFLRSFDPAR